MDTRGRKIRYFIFKSQSSNRLDPRFVKLCPPVDMYLHPLWLTCAILHESMPGLPPLISRSGTLCDCLTEVLQGRLAEVVVVVVGFAFLAIS